MSRMFKVIVLHWLQFERELAAIPIIYSGGHTGYPSEAWVELGRASYRIDKFLTDEGSTLFTAGFFNEVDIINGFVRI